MSGSTEVYRKSDGLKVLIPPSDLGFYEGLGFTRIPPPWEETPLVIEGTAPSPVLTVGEPPQEVPVEQDVIGGSVEESPVETLVLSRDYPVTTDGWIHKVSANRYYVELEHRLSTRNVDVEVVSYEGGGEPPLVKWTAISLSKVKVEVAALPDMRFTGVLRVIAK